MFYSAEVWKFTKDTERNRQTLGNSSNDKRNVKNEFVAFGYVDKWNPNGIIN